MHIMNLAIYTIDYVHGVGLCIECTFSLSHGMFSFGAGYNNHNNIIIKNYSFSCNLNVLCCFRQKI